MATELRQFDRIASFRTPAGEDEFALRRFESEESLSGLFTYKIEAVSQSENFDLRKIMGEKCSVTINLKNGQKKVFSGILVESQWIGADAKLHIYHFVLRPWLWLLSQRSDCRIFKDTTILDILTTIFKKEGKSSVTPRLGEGPRPIEYCVQYRESDLEFAHRLMEQHGIYYYFKHSDSDHTLVLSDTKSSHDLVTAAAEPSFAGAGTAHRFLPVTSSLSRHVEHFTEWSTQRRLRTGKVELRDYDFTQSTADLTSRAEDGFDKTKAFEQYDYPGAYRSRDVGDQFATIRAQSAQAVDDRRHATGDAPSLYPGALMTLADHPTTDENGEYLVVRARHVYAAQDYRSAGQGGDGTYQCFYELQDSDRRFRAPIVTPRPIIPGLDTAKVTGKKNEGEEGDIDVDEYGRILLRFHWDREDGSTSCRVRVAQVWSGAGWGGQIIPRIGQEVVVEFLEGDPDRPLVTGTVVNDKHMPPYSLPDNRTQSGLKSESTYGAGVTGMYNEIMFEDKAYEEVLSLRAEKDHKNVIRNIETREIGEAFVGGEFSRETTLLKGSDKLDIQRGKLDVEAREEIVLKVGLSTIRMLPSSIEINSPKITITSTAQTEVLSDALVIINGKAMVKIN